MSTSYVLECVKTKTVINLFRDLYNAKNQLSRLAANEYRIIAINEYQGYKFEGPHIYYLTYNGTRFIKTKK